MCIPIIKFNQVLEYIETEWREERQRGNDSMDKRYKSFNVLLIKRYSIKIHTHTYIYIRHFSLAVHLTHVGTSREN